MKRIVYGDSRELRLIETPMTDPRSGEVRVRIIVSGVNPTDWKQRARLPDGDSDEKLRTPHHDGAGVVDAIGESVTDFAPGDRVWVHAAAHDRQGGTAQEYVVLPQRLVASLPDRASFEDGAALGVPAMTAHRALTSHEGAPIQLSPRSLTGQTILVAGGAGAVGHAAIQLARWAGASVVSTVSNESKASLARAAGAHLTVDYRHPAAAACIRSFAPRGIHVVVEVAPMHNASLNNEVLAPGGTIAIYANHGSDTVQLDFSAVLKKNARYQFIRVFTMPSQASNAAVAAIQDALADGALKVGADAGLEIVHFPLESSAEAQDAVASGVVGKVLVDVTCFDASTYDDRPHNEASKPPRRG